MKIIFFGSDDFALAYLQALINTPHEVAACVTQPDRRKGRGMKVIVSSIKDCAQKHSIPVLQPESLKDALFIKKLKSFKSDIFVVIAYGQFLPELVFNISPFGAINVHPSLLPKYRGAAPVNWAIINGEQETGIAIIKINAKMDAGDVLALTKIKIADDDTAVTLRAKMMHIGPAFLAQTLDGLCRGTACRTPTAQNDRLATIAPKLTKELGIISWTRKAVDIYNLVRGLLPWPSAYTFYKGKLLKILEAQVIEEDVSQSEPGTVLKIIKEGFVVATGQKGLLIKRVHLQDSKPMDVSAFLRGHEIKVGFKFE